MHSAVGSAIAVALALATVVTPKRAAAQTPTGIVEGRVTEAASGRAVEGAQVFIDGSRFGANTNSQGGYRIVGVPPGTGQVRLRVRALGYAPLTRDIAVQAGQTSRHDMALSSSALQLDQVVITGSGQRTEVKRLGNTVAVIQPPANAPINDISNLMTAREPGLSTIIGGGLAGEGARIRIRGNASLTQTNEPVVFVDGVRVNSGGNFGIGTGGGGSPSRLDDIDPSTIERVEVLKGAAAATLYGTEASNGVIQIFTKKGSTGTPRWNFTAQQDAIQFSDRVAPNSGYAKTQGQADSVGAYWQLPGLRPFQVFEIPIFKRYFSETGKATTLSGSVNGGDPVITYFVSGRLYDEDGPFGGEAYGPARDHVRRIQSSASVSLVPTSKMRIATRNHYFNIRNETIENNNNIYGANSQVYMARPELANCRASSYVAPGKCSGPGNPFGNQAFMTAREAMNQLNQTAVSRYLGILDGEYRLTEELTASLALGYDYTAQRSIGFSPFGYNVDLFTSQTPEGARSTFSLSTRVLTLDAKGSFNRSIGPFSSAFAAGVQVFNDRTETTTGASEKFPGPGIAVVGAGGAAITTGETFLTTVNGGYFAQEQIGWRDWVFATLGGRYDFSSAFGESAKGIWYPKASLSVVPSDLKGWRSPLGLNTLRLRAAIGQSGRQPGAFDKFTTFGPLTSSLGPGLEPSQLGNQDLRPEVSTEIEAGFEAGILDNRLAFEFTAWDRIVKDALVTRQFASSGGFRRAQLTNIGQVDANGLELNVRGYPYQGRGTSVELFANAAYLKQILTSLGGAPPIKVGYFRYRGFLKEKDPLGSLYAPRLAQPCPNGGTAPAMNSANKPIACYGPGQLPINLNGTGRAATTQELLAYFSQPRDLRSSAVQSAVAPLLADYDGNNNPLEQRVGDVIPDWQGAFGSTVTFLRDWRVQALFEWRTGFLVQNLTDGFRASQHPSIGSNKLAYSTLEATILNPASTPEQRVAAAELYISKHRRLLEPGLHQGEPGDFLRWREVAVTYTAPVSLANRVGAKSMAITAAGRNLLLWTKYSGLDPESNENGRGAVGGVDGNFLVSTDGFGLPIPRRVSLAINLGF